MRVFLPRVFLSRTNIACAAYVTIVANCDLRVCCRRWPCGEALIETRRLLLRYFLPADWQDVHAYAALPEVSRYDSWGPNTEADSRAFIARCIEQAALEPLLRQDFAIELKTTTRVIGGCAIKREPGDANCASLGYAIHPDFQGRGFATEATLGLIEYGFRSLDLQRIVAQCDTRNGASCRVMEKAGMTRVGTHLNHREIKGRLTHAFEYGIDRSDRGV